MYGTKFAKIFLNTWPERMPPIKQIPGQFVGEGGARALMKKEVIVLDADKKQSQNLCTLLKDHTYTTTTMNSLANMDQYVDESDCSAVILNLDNVAVTNKILRDLKRKKPLINIIAISKRQFHPELEEALREHISVCLAEPVDSDELVYWLKTIFENS